MYRACVGTAQIHIYFTYLMYHLLVWSVNLIMQPAQQLVTGGEFIGEMGYFLSSGACFGISKVTNNFFCLSCDICFVLSYLYIILHF